MSNENDEEKLWPGKKKFIDFCQENDVLQFGEFITKAARKSPYFFNLGRFSSGKSIEKLSMYYAEKILLLGENPDIIFGPAYKGISLCVAVAVALAHLGMSISFCYNRKEEKDHGEYGSTVGAPLEGKKVLIIDDVLSSGLSIRESQKVITENGGLIIGAVVAVDREERGLEQSAHLELREAGIPVHSLISLSDLILYVRTTPKFSKYLDAIIDYQEKNGAR